MAFQYPSPRRDESCVEKIHGRDIADAYRWMEDPDADETKAFVDKQNLISEPYINKCSFKNKLKGWLTEMWDYPKYSCPMEEGNNIYYFFNSGLQNQSVLYVQNDPQTEARVFLDPNSLSEDGTVAIRGYTFTEDGSLFAYGLSAKGSDWVSIKFKDCTSGADLPDVLERVKFSCMTWTHDNKGLFYNMYPESYTGQDGRATKSNLNQQLMYHRMGTSQKEDVLCIKWPENPEWLTGADVSDCGRYVILTIRQGCDPVNRLYYIDLASLPNGITSGPLPYTKIVDNFDAEYLFIQNEGTTFTFRTNRNAPKYKLINIDLQNPAEENWVELVPEHEKDVLDWADCVNNNKLVLCYLHDVKSVLEIFDLNTGKPLSNLPLQIGSVVGFSGKKKKSSIFYQFMSFLTPGIIYQCDMNTLKPQIFKEIQVKGFNHNDFVTEQVFYPSKDGTKIPMFIVHKKNLVKDGQQPVLLYGYGGFNISITPVFSVSRAVFMTHLNGMVAVPNIRGGGEYGEDWHQGGTFGNKQNVFDDFMSAAKYLAQAGYTNPKKIVIQGGSNGGLLVGACINQQPQLFGCAIAQVGVMDMLRFHKFTIGHAWITDFGNPDKDNDFEHIYKYSPLHNIKVPCGEIQYPPTLLLTADHDDRVVPLHSLKYIAELQRVVGKEQKQTNPLLIKVDTKAGHGAGKPTTKTIEELTDVYSFIALSLNLQCQE